MDIISVQPEEFRSKLPIYVKQDVKDLGISSWADSDYYMDIDLLSECRVNQLKVELVMRNGQAIKGIAVEKGLYNIKLMLVIDGTNVVCNIDLRDFYEINKIPTRSEAMKVFYSTEEGLLQKYKQSKRMMGNQNKTGRGNPPVDLFNWLSYWND